MADIREIENTIINHEKRLIDLVNGNCNADRITAIKKLIEFWKNRKNIIIRIKNRKHE